MLEQEQSQSDVNEEVSSEPSSTETNNISADSEEKASTDSKDMPFHEHPRFRELVEQKNKYADSYKSLESKYAEMEKRLNEMTKATPSKKEEDALIARLKGVDPEFGERFAKLDATQQELAELKAWRSQMEGDRVREGAVNTIQSLHGQNKVSSEMQELYNEQLEALYARNPQGFLKDINASYKAVHERMSKVMEGIKRAERESYVQGKKADVKAPTAATKGKAVNPAKASDYSNDPALARQQLVQRVLKQAKASNNL
jgi:hypothetical protein